MRPPSLDDANRRKTEVLKALKANPKLAPLAHEIQLEKAEGPDSKLVYAKILLKGKNGKLHEVGFVGIYKDNPNYVLLEDMQHKKVDLFVDMEILAREAAEKLRWGSLEVVPGVVPPGT